MNKCAVYEPKMLKLDDRILRIPSTFKDIWSTILNHLKNSGVPPLDNSTQQYDAFFNSLLNLSMNFTNSSRPDNITDYDAVLDECSPFLGALDFLHKYILPVIIAAGLLGNVVSGVVFLNTHLRMRSSSYYLAALSATDFSFLLMLLLVWLNSNAGVQVFNKNGWCQVLVYISSVCGFLSSWLIVAFTVERFIAVQYPLHRPRMCTVARAKAIVCCLVVFALILHSYSFVTAGLVKQYDGSEVCHMLEDYRETMRIMNIVDCLVSLIIPLILITSMNSMIGRNFLKFRRHFKQNPEIRTSMEGLGMERSDINLQHIHMSSSGNRRTLQLSCQTCRSNSSRHVQMRTNHPERVTRNTVSHVISCNGNMMYIRAQQNITKMLLLVSSVFILLNLPSYVIRLYVFVCFSLWGQEAPASLWCLQQFFMLLYYTNFSINFLLYSVCGITFRRCMCQLVRKNFKRLPRYRMNPQPYT